MEKLGGVLICNRSTRLLFRMISHCKFPLHFLFPCWNRFISFANCRGRYLARHSLIFDSVPQCKYCETLINLFLFFSWQLLMGFESGLLALWDLRTKAAEARFVSTEPLRSASWLSDGKQLVSAHTDGSICTWNTRAGPRPAPVLVSYPHGTCFSFIF